MAEEDPMEEIQRLTDELHKAKEELERVTAERDAFAEAIEGAYPKLVDEQMAAMKAKGSPLTPDKMKRLNEELVERSKAIADGLQRLNELGASKELILEVASPGPDGALDRIRAAIAELEADQQA